MKQYVMIIILLNICFLTSCKQEDPGSFQYNLLKTNETIAIDGVLNESPWKSAQRFTLRENESGATVTDSTVMTNGMACYDTENIYFAFVCMDPDIWCDFTRRDEYLWKEEVVEIFIDTDDNPEDYVEIEVSPSNVLFDSYIVNPQKIDFVQTSKFNLEGIKTAVKVDGTLNKRDDLDRNWTVEISIPFADLIEVCDLNVNELKTWRVNFYRVNRDSGQETGKYAWSPTLERFHSPSKFGILNFNQIKF